MIQQLFSGMDVATILGVLVGTVIPFLSALVTKHPSFLTGVITLGLSTASGFLSEWANAASHNVDYNWKVGLGTALGTWIVAVVTHSKILSGTKVEADLHAVGTGSAPPA